MPLKCLSNLWRTPEMSLFNCEFNPILTWSEDCVISSAAGAAKFKITDTKLYVPVITLSTQDNSKLLQQLKSGFKRTINWNKYQRKVSKEVPNQYSRFLIDPSFQRVTRLFVLSFENEDDRKVSTGYYLPKKEIRYYNVMTDGKNFFDKPVENDLRTYNNIRKITIGQGDDYTTVCPLDYNYFNECYKMITIDLKQQALDADPKAIQQMDITGNLERVRNAAGQIIDANTIMFFILEEAKKAVLNFSQGTVKVF